MLAGEPPFTGATTQAILAERFTEPAPSLRAVRSSVPESVDQAIRKSLAPVPADRFSTAAEFARALEESGSKTTAGVGASTPTVTVAAPGRVSRRPLTLALAIGFVLGLGVLFGWLRSHGGAEPAGPGTTKLLAVLPFENLGDSTDEYFADGITDEVRGKLATLSGLKVIASSSASQYKRSAKSPQQIAEELGVQYLLIGKIRWEKREGGQSRVRVSPELVQVAPGSAATTRWQQPFDAALTDVFQVQADIAGRVAQELNVALSDNTQQDLAAKPTQNLAAYDAYLKGTEALNQGSSPVTLRQAMNYFEQAIALDTLFAPAWARLSQSASLLSVVGAPSPALAARSREAAERALALAPDRPDGHAALGDYYRRITRDQARALDEYAQGERQSPSNAQLFRGIAQAEQALGRWEPALQHLRQAQRLDPRSATVANVLTYCPRVHPAARGRPGKRCSMDRPLPSQSPGSAVQGDDPARPGRSRRR